MNDIEYGLTVRLSTFRTFCHKGDQISSITSGSGTEHVFDPPWVAPQDGMYMVDIAAGTISLVGSAWM